MTDQRICTFFVGLCFLSTSLRAQANEIENSSPTFVTFLQVGGGYIQDTPFPSSAHETISGVGLLGLTHLALKLSPYKIRIRYGFGVVNVDLPGGAKISQTVYGNPELSIAKENIFDGFYGSSFSLGLALPLGSGDAVPEKTFLENQALYTLDAISGGRDSGLFSPARSALVPGAHIEDSIGDFNWSTEVKVPLLMLLSTPSTNADPNLRIHKLAASAILTGRAAYSLFGSFSGGLSSWLKYTVIDQAVDKTKSVSPTQLFVQPQFDWAAQPVQLSLSGMFPIGGALGGKVIGIHLAASAKF